MSSLPSLVLLVIFVVSAGVSGGTIADHGNRPCRGTVFAITLPLASVAEATPPVEPGSEAPERRRQNSAPEDNPSPK